MSYDGGTAIAHLSNDWDFSAQFETRRRRDNHFEPGGVGFDTALLSINAIPRLIELYRLGGLFDLPSRLFGHF
jgi:hypothetical protein